MMVAVPRSKGCLVCRKRSVKCDELRPSCSQCRRGGRKCSGYELPMNFILQQPYIKSLKKTPNHRKKRFPRQLIESQVTSGFQDFTLPLSPLHPQQQTSHVPSSYQTIYSPLLNLIQITTSFVTTLFPPTYLPANLSFFANWLWQIPQHLSPTNTLLTSAAQALALGFFGSETKNAALEHESREAYSRALWFLSKAVADRDVGLETETLCATMLLGFYEINMRTQKVSWVTHAGGAGRLMQIRGAGRHREGFDYVMFLGFRGIVIAEAVASGKQCFLDTEDWKSIVANHESYETSSEMFQFHDEFSNLFASVPGIAARLTEATKCSPGDESRIATIQSASSLRIAFKSWYLRFTTSHTTSHTHSSSTTNTTDQIWLSAWLCAYYACLIMLNTRLGLLKPCSCPSSTSTSTPIFTHPSLKTQNENAELINKLCIVVGICSRAGNAGGQCLAFALPMALSLCKGELEGWVVEGLAGEGGGDGGREGVDEKQIEMLRAFVRVKL